VRKVEPLVYVDAFLFLASLFVYICTFSALDFGSAPLLVHFGYISSFIVF